MDDGQGPLQVVGTIDWSVNGDIAFTAFPLGQSSFNTDLYVIRADGTGLRRLTQMSFVSGPVFSPDGSEILFAYNGDGTKLYRISSAGQPNDEVPIHFGYFNGSPLEDLGWDWSPDGTEIVLADPTYSDGELVIVKVRSTTTDATYTDDRVLIGRVGGAASVTDRQPSWRP
jgi:Tol biopolymer transport system component